MKKVEKRDGKLEDFNIDRIENAVNKACKSVDYSDPLLASSIAYVVSNAIVLDKKSGEVVSVEDIQDSVVKELFQRAPIVAKSYEKYRKNRDNKRNEKARKVFYEIIDTQATNVTRENANMNADTPAGQMMKFASETTRSFTNNDLLSEEARKAHIDGLIHIHDEDYYPTRSLTCVQHPLDNVLSNGFRAGHGASRPAKRIETASILGCISMETCQNEMHGGQAIPAFDFYLAPYVRKTFEEELNGVIKVTGYDVSYVKTALKENPIKDYLDKPIDELVGAERLIQYAVNRTTRRVHQSMEAFIHNMNTIHSRGGNQVVFGSINYGTDTSPEGRCVIRELLLSTYRGVGNGETAIFPIQIWKKKRGVSYLESDPNNDLYKLACKVTARRYFPNIINLDAPFNRNSKWRADDPKRYIYECATMGCRTRVFEDRFGEKTSIGRGNLSFTSINLVRLALECRDIKDREKAIEVFFDKLDNVLDLVARQLHDRYEFQATAKAKQFPLLMSSLWMGGDKLKPDDEIREVIKHGTLGIGFIGLAECLVALIGKHHGESEEAQKLGLKIIGHMKDKSVEYSNYYDHNYSILATPAEGLSGRFTRIDKKKFGIIKGVTDREYYTNSNHVPVYYKCTAEHKAKVEAPYHPLTLGGHIFYVELDGDATHNPDAVMKVVDLMDKYNIGYGSINHTRYRCLDCGFESALEFKKCPRCDSEAVDSLQRITGYLVGTTKRWNSAKNAERKDRVTHSL